MYQNSLHEVIEASKKMKVFPHVDLQDEILPDAGRLVLQIPSRAANAMCFYADIESIPEIDIVTELVRLPYKTCWFEIGCVDGPRICVLCTEENKKITSLLLTKGFDGAWVFRGVYWINPGSDVEALGVFSVIEQNCFHYLFRYLSALNCCNITRTEHKPKPSQQSVRRALGRQPLFSTWTLEIDLDRTERELPGESCGGHASKRLHLCRGHARQHKPGQWCWVRAHVRGDKSLGMIHKDYATH